MSNTPTTSDRLDHVEQVLTDLEKRLDSLERTVRTYHPAAPVTCKQCGRAHTSISKFCTYCSTKIPTLQE
jgi:hypothetical protein